MFLKDVSGSKSSGFNLVEDHTKVTKPRPQSVRPRSTQIRWVISPPGHHVTQDENCGKFPGEGPALYVSDTRCFYLQSEVVP